MENRADPAEQPASYEALLEQAKKEGTSDAVITILGRLIDSNRDLVKHKQGSQAKDRLQARQ